MLKITHLGVVAPLEVGRISITLLLPGQNLIPSLKYLLSRLELHLRALQPAEPNAFGSTMSERSQNDAQRIIRSNAFWRVVTSRPDNETGETE